MERRLLPDVLQRSVVQHDPKRLTNTKYHTGTCAYIPQTPLRCNVALRRHGNKDNISSSAQVSVEVHSNVGNTYHIRMVSHILAFNIMLQPQLQRPAIITHNLFIQYLETEYHLTVDCYRSHDICSHRTRMNIFDLQSRYISLVVLSKH